MSTRYALGIDYGTNSCRSLLVDLSDGREAGFDPFRRHVERRLTIP